MTDRVVAVLARPSAALPDSLVTAMLTDVLALAVATPDVDPAIAVTAGHDAGRHFPLAGVDLVAVAADPSVADLLQAVETTGAHAVAVVAADVPDLPETMLADLFSAMAGPRGASVAVCPGTGGGLVAVAAMIPVSGWLRQLPVRFDDPDAMTALTAGAPLTELSIGPGWHRIRVLDDLPLLDPDRLGWAATRDYLNEAPRW